MKRIRIDLIVDLRLIHYVKVIAETRNITRAAERLNLAQPSLTEQLQKVEERLGYSLFTRSKGSGRPVEPTHACDAFLQQAERALVYAERGYDAGKNVDREDRSALTVGYSPYIDLHFLSAVRQMKPLPPDHRRPTYRASFTSEIVDNVSRHEWQAGLVILPVIESDLAVTPLLIEPLAVALPKASELAERQQIELAELAGLPLILPPTHYQPVFHEYLFARLRDAGVAPEVAHEAPNPHEALHLVAEGLGVTIAQVSVLDSPRKGVVVRRFADDSLKIETGLITPSQNGHPGVQTLVEAILHVRDAYVEAHAVKGSKLHLVPKSAR